MTSENVEGAALGSKTFLTSLAHQKQQITRRTNDDLHALAQTLFRLFSPKHTPISFGKLEKDPLTEMGKPRFCVEGNIFISRKCSPDSPFII